MPRKKKARSPNARTAVCVFRLTEAELAAVQKALKSINPRPGHGEDGPAYGRADFYRAAVLALLADAADGKEGRAVVTRWLKEARS